MKELGLCLSKGEGFHGYGGFLGGWWWLGGSRGVVVVAGSWTGAVALFFPTRCRGE